jgi:hypothetical protein
MGLKAIWAAAVGFGLLVGGTLGYLTWARAKGAGQITHPDVYLGNTGPADGKSQLNRPRR